MCNSYVKLKLKIAIPHCAVPYNPITCYVETNSVE